MSKKMFVVLIALFSLTLIMGVAFSAVHRVEILRSASINGVDLKPGNYALAVVDENTAEIYKGKKLLVKAKIEVVPLAGATPGSVSQGVDGKVREIRLKEEKVVFVDAITGSGH